MPNPFNENWQPNKQYVESREVKLAVLQHGYLESESLEDKQYWRGMIENELEERNKTDVIFDDY